MRGESSRYYGDQCLFHGNVERVMGTCLDLLIVGVDATAATRIWKESCRLLEDYEHVFDRFDSGSEVSIANESLRQGRSIEVSETLENATRQCMEFCRRTEGIFDITRGKSSCLKLDGKVIGCDGEADLDFGGFAKGFALRGIMDILKEWRVRDAFCDFGRSSILALGVHPAGVCWRVELNSPYDGRVVSVYDLKDQCLSTSGNTPGYFGHIVDPRNGEKKDEKVLATAVSSDPVEAEVLSTAVVAANLEDKDRLRDVFPDAELDKFYL